MIIISMVLAVAFMVIVSIKGGGVPKSISSLVYCLPKNWQWMWSAWLFLCGVTASAGMIEYLPDAWKGLGFATMVGLGFTAAMPLVMKDQVKSHNIISVCAGVLSQVAVILINPNWMLVWFSVAIVVAGVMLLAKGDVWSYVQERRIMLLEVICAITIYGSLLVH